MKPLLRWAGGKQWISERLCRMVPDDIGTYYEPFAGGGSLFFRLLPDRAILSDLNVQLMEAYRVMRDYPNRLAAVLGRWPNNEATYYRVRNANYSDRINRAAQLIYLNRTCWNGLYRVNRSGKFNVPFGRNGRRVFDNGHLLNVSKSLQNVKLCCGDFATVVGTASAGDFVYLDPPYSTHRKRNGFIQYNEKIFSWNDQRRLGDIAVRLADRGCHVVITNVGYKPILEFYPGFSHKEISRSSVLAADPSFRQPTTELLIYSKGLCPIRQAQG
ncbi:MAG: Dam family site-specific DNA-(adenine-N6)-methyltransferase [Chloroflexota bacterium]|nr:Dam family site-specific DNA-(adenine-N6)-methyltransferase [Chloroflexota bacterium]MDE2959161.1 Dam family site-specific DNA-(adenine-N6)-methyltransferase [Chloroflexota bacterium]